MGEVTVIGEGFQTEELLHLVNLRGIAVGEDMIDLGDQAVDAADTVLRSILLNRVVPESIVRNLQNTPSIGENIPFQSI